MLACHKKLLSSPEHRKQLRSRHRCACYRQSVPPPALHIIKKWVSQATWMKWHAKQIGLLTLRVNVSRFLLVLRHQVIHVVLCFSELHLIHAFPCIPVKKGLLPDHGSELLAGAWYQLYRIRLSQNHYGEKGVLVAHAEALYGTVTPEAVYISHIYPTHICMVYIHIICMYTKHVCQTQWS